MHQTLTSFNTRPPKLHRRTLGTIQHRLLQCSQLSFLPPMGEMDPVVMAAISVHEWLKTIAIYSENSTVRNGIIKGQSHCLDIMLFMWRFTIVWAQHQFIVWASHVPSHKNFIADSLSLSRNWDVWLNSHTPSCWHKILTRARNVY